MKHWRPILIYLFGLGLLWLNTLPTDYLLGTDVHLEYYFAQQALVNGWDPALAHPGNSALSITVLAPFLSKVFSIPLEWIFKAVYPAMFAFVPVILYYVFKKFFSKNESFSASIFFILVPTFAMEIAGIGRQQIAELFLALYLLALVSSVRLRLRVPIMLGLAFAIALAHYSIGVVVIMITTLYCIFATAYNIKDHLLGATRWTRRKTTAVPVLAMTILLLLITVGSIAYWGWAGGGTPLRYMTHLIPVEETQIGIYKIGNVPSNESLEVSEAPAKVMNLAQQKYDSLMQVAIGLDFAQAPIPGKIFRVLQYLTQIALLIGFVFVMLSRKVARTYKILALSGATIVGALIIFPVFSAILNATRWYHLALFLLAPAAIIPFTRIIKKPIILAVLLVAYGLFTSGAIFEATQQTDISKPNIPYSVGLSGQRLDLAGNFTEDDIKVREWLSNSDIKVIYSDLPGMLFLQEVMALEKNLYTWKHMEDIKTDTVIFLRSSNNNTGYVTIYTGVGARSNRTIDTDGMETIYKSGDSEVLIGYE